MRNKTPNRREVSIKLRCRLTRFNLIAINAQIRSSDVVEFNRAFRRGSCLIHMASLLILNGLNKSKPTSSGTAIDAPYIHLK